MLLFQELIFKNDINGNSRRAIAVYEKTPKSKYSYILQYLNCKGRDMIQTLNEEGYPVKHLDCNILPSIYYWSNWSTIKKQFNNGG